jgi:predicted Zn-dependent protease
MSAAYTLDTAETATTSIGVDLAQVKRQLARRYVQQLHGIARELYDCELYREASDLLRYLTMVEPTNPTYWYWLGRALFSLGDPMKAAHVFELGGRISHLGQFQDLAAEAWRRAGYPDRAKALSELEGVAG